MRLCHFKAVIMPLVCKEETLNNCHWPITPPSLPHQMIGVQTVMPGQLTPSLMAIEHVQVFLFTGDPNFPSPISGYRTYLLGPTCAHMYTQYTHYARTNDNYRELVEVEALWCWVSSHSPRGHTVLCGPNPQTHSLTSKQFCSLPNVRTYVYITPHTQ